MGKNQKIEEEKKGEQKGPNPVLMQREGHPLIANKKITEIMPFLRPY
jgi:hypothetical protein